MMSHVTHVLPAFDSRCVLCVVFCYLLCVYDFHICTRIYMMSQVTHMFNESCHTYILRHVTRLWRVMSRMYYLSSPRDACCVLFFCIFLCVYDFHMCTKIYMMSHITRIWWVMSHINNESCHTYMTSHATHVPPVFDSSHVLCVFFGYLFCVYDFHMCTRIYMMSHLTRV